MATKPINPHKVTLSGECRALNLGKPHFWDCGTYISKQICLIQSHSEWVLNKLEGLIYRCGLHWALTPCDSFPLHVVSATSETSEGRKEGNQLVITGHVWQRQHAISRAGNFKHCKHTRNPTLGDWSHMVAVGWYCFSVNKAAGCLSI